MSEIAIRVEGLGKQYRLGQSRERYVTLRDQIRKWTSPRGWFRHSAVQSDNTDFWALKDVNFQVKRGEVLGIIGRNGAGKSTLLKILSRITEPTEGGVDIHGRVGSLLEVGTGFHPELTGRENIFLNGAILGMKREEIVRKFDEIVAFAEVKKFIDTPVKHYSSGMYMRLAFAVAANLEPEILVVDEVLAVGDAEFQKKCLGKMGDVARGGRTVLFVSHNMAAIQNLCQRVVILDRGRVLSADSAPTAAIRQYLSHSGKTYGQKWIRGNLPASGPLTVEQAALQLCGFQPAHFLRLSISLRSWSLHRPAFLAVNIHNPIGDSIMQAIPCLDSFLCYDTELRIVEVKINLPPLVPDTYSLSLWLGSHFSETLVHLQSCLAFTVETSPTPGRSFPHTADQGFIVPYSEVVAGRPARQGDS